MGGQVPVTEFSYKGKALVKISPDTTVMTLASVDNDMLQALNNLADALDAPDSCSDRHERAEVEPPTGALTTMAIEQTVTALMPDGLPGSRGAAPPPCNTLAAPCSRVDVCSETTDVVACGETYQVMVASSRSARTGTASRGGVPMEFRRPLVLIAFLVVTALCQAEAAPIAIGEAVDHGDYSTVTHTGLDWVDITLTYGMSYNDVIASSWYADGWRHASLADVKTLFDAFNPSGTDPFWEDDWSAYYEGIGSSMAPFIGANTDLVPGLTYIAAIRDSEGVEAANLGPGRHVYSLVQDWDQRPGEDFVDITQSAQNDDAGISWLGHFLVRETSSDPPMPEPSTLVLLGAGVAVLAWRRRRRTTA